MVEPADAEGAEALDRLGLGDPDLMHREHAIAKEGQFLAGRVELGEIGQAGSASLAKEPRDRLGIRRPGPSQQRAQTTRLSALGPSRSRAATRPNPSASVLISSTAETQIRTASGGAWSTAKVSADRSRRPRRAPAATKSAARHGGGRWSMP